METRPIFVLLLLLVGNGAFAQAYKWTDENGVVHYSDRPHPGAEVVDLGPSRASRPPPVTSNSDNAADEDAAEETDDILDGYTSLEVASPGSEETLWNIGAILNVSLALEPALQPGHQVRVYFDGVPRAVSGTSFQIDEVHRGVHNLQAEILDANGRLMIRSRTNRFYVQQNSIL